MNKDGRGRVAFLRRSAPTDARTLSTQLFGEAGGALAAKFFYASLVTLPVIFATMAVARAAERAKRLEAERDRGLLGLGRSKE